MVTTTDVFHVNQEVVHIIATIILHIGLLCEKHLLILI